MTENKSPQKISSLTYQIKIAFAMKKISGHGNESVIEVTKVCISVIAKTKNKKQIKFW